MRSWLGGIKASNLEGLQLQCSASLTVMIVTHELPREVSSSEGGDVFPLPPSPPPSSAALTSFGHGSRCGPSFGSWNMQLRKFTTKKFIVWVC